MVIWLQSLRFRELIFLRKGHRDEKYEVLNVFEAVLKHKCMQQYDQYVKSKLLECNF